MKTFLIFIFSILIFLTACSKEKSAGVITDTHTTSQIAGKIQDSKNQPVSARVRIVPSTFLAMGDAPEFEVYSDSNGYFIFDSIPIGNWNLIITDTNSNLVFVQSFNWSSFSEEMLDLGFVVATPASTIIIPLNRFDLTEMDTLFIPGTDAAIVITATMLNKGSATLTNVPNNIALTISAKKSDSTASLTTISSINSNDQIILTGDSLQPFVKPSSLIMKLTFPSSFPSDAIDIQNMPFPVWLPDSIKNPCFIDSENNLILLDSTFTQGDSNLYWGTAFSMSFSLSSQFEFKIIESCNIQSETPALGRLSLHMDQESDSLSLWGNSLWLDSSSPPFMINSFYPLVDSASIGASLWIRMLGSEQTDTYTQIFDTRSNNSGVRIQQRAGLNSLQIRIDSKDGDYNAIFGASAILDGAWHHYAFSMTGNKILVVSDGNVIVDTTFNPGSGFSNSYNPIIGGISNMKGHVDEVMFFDGSQTGFWWQALHALQKPSVTWTLR